MKDQYTINRKQVVAVNILLKILQEAINRKTFSNEEENKIYETVEILNKKYT